MKTKLVLALVALLVVVGVVGSGARWWYGRQLAAQRIELANARADADTLRTVAQDLEAELTTVEQRARIAEQERDLAVGLNDQLRDHMEKQGRTLRGVVNLLGELEARVALEGTAELAGDSTRIPFEHHDDAVDLRVDLAFAGRIMPDPTPRVQGAAEIVARIRQQLALGCNPEGEPVVNATTFDNRFRITQLETTVSPDVACFPEPPSFLETFVPKLSPGTAVVAGVFYFLGRIF